MEKPVLLAVVQHVSNLDLVLDCSMLMVRFALVLLLAVVAVVANVVVVVDFYFVFVSVQRCLLITLPFLQYQHSVS